jgi:glycine hydroxymethyltransferase
MDSIQKLVRKEKLRQEETLMMIPSENYTSREVREAVGSVLMNKYSEGYPGKRYYQGNKIADEVEQLAIDRAKKLFGTPHANVQPYSGTPANSAVLFALLEAGDILMGMDLSSGGHLTHGHPKITFSGKYFKSVQFDLDEKGLINYLKVERIAKKEKPKLMIIGTTAYPRILDWVKFAKIADSIGAWFVADVSHIAGLIVSDAYPSPVKHAHVITTTTHKTLRGPRGAMIMATKKGVAKDKDLPEKIDRAVFPGMQGGPHNNQTAGIAVALKQASEKSFKDYGKKVVKNAKILADELKKGDFSLVTDGTDSHLLLIDLRNNGLSGNVVAEALEVAGIIVNKNSIPNDTMPPFYPSGIRLGTPAVTTRGMGGAEMKVISTWIIDAVESIKEYKLPKNPKGRVNFLKAFRGKVVNNKQLLAINEEVGKLCITFPIKG